MRERTIRYRLSIIQEKEEELYKRYWSWIKKFETREREIKEKKKKLERLLEKEIEKNKELEDRNKEEKENRELMEINIDSPINIRKKHREERAKWLKRERENTRREINRAFKKMKRMREKKRRELWKRTQN